MTDRERTNLKKALDAYVSTMEAIIAARTDEPPTWDDLCAANAQANAAYVAVRDAE